MDVAEALRDWPWPFSVDTPVLVGVSGGVDSMVLAEGLVRAGFSRLVVAHVHHGLRAEEADADEALVREWADVRGCAYEAARVDVAARASADGLSIETAGRQVRREFFREVAARRGLRHVLLAHHADDQVETLLMNLLRGAGTHGMAGMRPISEWHGLYLVRPLLGVWRREIEAWARAQGIGWREDASNVSADHLRNRLRHEVMPMLEKAVGHSVRDALRRAALLAADDDDELAATADRAGREATAEDGSLAVATLAALPAAIARRVLRAWLMENAVSDLGFKEVEAVWRVASARGRPASCNVSGNRRVRRRAGRLFLDRQGSA